MIASDRWIGVRNYGGYFKAARLGLDVGGDVQWQTQTSHGQEEGTAWCFFLDVGCNFLLQTQTSHGRIWSIL